MTTMSIPIQLQHLHASGSTCLQGKLVWDSTDPLAVRLALGEQGIVWTVGRELLSAGLHDTAGVGDVRVRPHLFHSQLVQIDLQSDSGTGSFTLRRQLLGDFLRSTWLVVSREQEDAIVLAELDGLDWASPVGDDTGGAQ